MDTQSLISMIALIALPLIFGITLHEAAHGWVASKLGDKTALMLGRVSLNPVKHISLVGTIIVPIVLTFLSGFTFGWAKPVPITWQNLRNPKRDIALVALAGPAANLVMALAWGLITKLSLMALIHPNWSPMLLGTANYFKAAGIYGIQINLFLCALNLIPIPPLDGSKVISSLLPRRTAYQYGKIAPYGIWILLLLLVTHMLYAIIIPPVSYGMVVIAKLFGI